MSTILGLDILDVARSLGDAPFQATPQSVADWLLEYNARSGGGFNYDPAINTIVDAFGGRHTLESAVSYCETHGNPKGRNQNASAIRALMPHILANTSTCYRIGLTAVAIGRFEGRTVYAKIKAPLLRVRDNKAYVVMPGLRLGHTPTEVSIDLACSVALANYAQDDFEMADFEYLYSGRALGGGRQFKAIYGKDRFRFSDDAIDRLLDIYVQGVAIAHQQGADTNTPTLRGYRIVDPRAPRFI